MKAEGGVGWQHHFGVPCLDIKSFIASLALITLLLALWQLHPYHSIILASSHLSTSSSPSSCVLSNSTTTTTIANLFDSTSNSTTNITTPTPAPNLPTKSTSFALSRRAKAAAAVAKAEPNKLKREFRAYGNAAALFVQMGAYRGGPTTFAIVGLASKPVHVFGRPYFKCQWIPNGGGPPIRTKAYTMLPDWGYGRVYTVVIVNCTFPSNPNADNAGGKLQVHAYYSVSSRRYEKFIALEEAPGAYDESVFHPPFRYDYLYCGSSLYGNLSSSRLREWMAYHAHFFGPRSHFVFHDAGGVTPEVLSVLQPWVDAGWLTIQDIRAQAGYDGYYYNQFLVVNDCLHRHRHAANWTFFFDVDEYLYLPDGHTLQQVLARLDRYTQFTIQQNPMSSKLCVQDQRKDYASEWGFEKLVFRNSMTRIRRDRKYAIQARNAYSAGVHMSQNVFGRTNHKTESLIKYYHYHNSINVLGEPCQQFVPKPSSRNNTWFEGVPYVYDDNMKRIASKIKQFEKETIGSTHT